MAFVALTSGAIATGEPVTNTSLDLIRTNLDDLDSRITTLAVGTVATTPIILSVNGTYTNYVMNGILKDTINSNIRITGVFLLIDQAGSSGSTTIDIKYSRAGSAYQSILTTLPSIPYTDGNDKISSTSGTAAVIDVTYRDLNAGDLIRLDVTAVQTAGVNFMVRIDFNQR